MYLVRELFKAKPGHAKNIVNVFKQAATKGSNYGFMNMKIMTDFVAEYWTVVIQYEIESLDKFGSQTRSFTSSPEMASIFKDYLNYVDAGKREIFLLEN